MVEWRARIVFCTGPCETTIVEQKDGVRLLVSKELVSELVHWLHHSALLMRAQIVGSTHRIDP